MGRGGSNPPSDTPTACENSGSPESKFAPGLSHFMIRAMDEEPGETARLNEPHAGDLSKGHAVTSLVLGILAFVIQLLAWGDWFIRIGNKMQPSSASLRGGVLIRSRPIPWGS
jgi:hypothetical protein